MATPLGWHSRGYLPHFDAGDVMQFVTFRLADSLPQFLLDQWRRELRDKPPELAYVETWRRAERYLDEGHGQCLLRDARAARIAEEALLYFDGSRYRLHEWVVMPNHVHTLFTPIEPFAMSTIVSSWKSFTVNQIQKAIDVKGSLWQREYFDRYIRGEDHWRMTARYIRENPVKAGLCATAEAWPFGSARRRVLAWAR